MLNSKKVIKNSIWIIAGYLYTAIFSFVINIFTANYLGPSNAGILGYITSFVNFFASLGCLGFTNVIVKEIINNKDHEGAVVGTAFCLQLISLCICYGITVLTVYLCNIGDRTMLICTVLQATIIVFRVFDNFTYYFQAKLESKYIAIISMVAYTIMQLYKIYLLVTSKTVKWFAAAQAIDVLIVAIAITVVYIFKKAPKLSFSKDIMKTLFRQGLPYMIMGTIGLLYGSVDRIMLKEMLCSTFEVGIYTQAFSLSHFWSFVASAIIVSFSTMVYEASGLYGTDSEEYKLKMRQLYCIVFWICVIVAICLSIALPILIHFVYEQEYQKAIVPSIVLTWAAVFAFMGSAKSVQLLSEEKQKYGILFSILTVILNVIMNALMIPSMGSLGAAIATLVSEAFICFGSPFILKKTRNIGITMGQGVCLRNVHFKEIIAMIKQKLHHKKNNTITQKSDKQSLEQSKSNKPTENASEIDTNQINETTQEGEEKDE